MSYYTKLIKVLRKNNKELSTELDAALKEVVRLERKIKVLQGDITGLKGALKFHRERKY